jgi:hypothetical protein
MAPRRPPQPPQPPDVRQFRTVAEIETTITKLKRRIADIERLRTENIRHDDDRVENVEHAVRDTILEEFGKDSPEFQRHAYFKVDDGPRLVRSDFFGGVGDWDAQDQQRLIAAIPGAMSRVEGLIERLQEKKADLGEPSIAPRAAFQGRKLNPAIVAAAAALYLDGHYPQAVFEAGKTLVALVKAKSGKFDVDGAPRMQAVFSVNNPILAFNNLAGSVRSRRAAGHDAAVRRRRNGHSKPWRSPRRNGRATRACASTSRPSELPG